MPKHYRKNPRQITQRQLSDLEKWLDEFGDLSGIVHNLPTDELIGGNQRGRIFDLIGRDENIVITEQLAEPDEQGTIATGYVEWRGHRYTYRAVVWDEDQARRANIIANKAGGTFDFDMLANEWDMPELMELGFEGFELGIEGGNGDGTGATDDDEQYSRKIESPVYEPKNEKPSVSELFDDAKTQTLIANIDAAEWLTEEERTFLTIAARRHTVLSYSKIADYYAHADEPLQYLMENSALVIIDFDRAIELGFVQLTECIAEMVRDEYGE